MSSDENGGHRPLQGGYQPPEDGHRPAQGGYTPSEVEAKWQGRWDKLGTNRFTGDALRTAENGYYQLMMFPYPSAEGLHAGNIFAYTGADVHGRFQRLNVTRVRRGRVAGRQRRRPHRRGVWDGRDRHRPA